MVFFSSTSFTLSVDSLQCCIGGSSSGFNVLQLDDRKFRFSVASNKVGHFIYGLKDRVWPDFICHLSLYKELITRQGHLPDLFWCSDYHLSDIAIRTPVAVKSDLRFLEDSSRNDDSSHSELAKFGLSKICKPAMGLLIQEFNAAANDCHEPITRRSPPMSIPSNDVSPSNGLNSLNASTIQFGKLSPTDFTDHIPTLHSSSVSESICLGSFQMPIPMDKAGPKGLIFCGSQQNSLVWNDIPDETLLHILDLRRAKYSDQVIAITCDIPSIRSEQYIAKRLAKCANCSTIGHIVTGCKARRCSKCHLFDRACSCGPDLCSIWNRSDHFAILCPAHFFCTRCQYLGHTGQQCGYSPVGPTRFFWRPKSHFAARVSK